MDDEIEKAQMMYDDVEKACNRAIQVFEELLGHLPPDEYYFALDSLRVTVEDEIDAVEPSI